MAIKNALASVAVKDIQASTKWYERLFARAADSTPAHELAEWKFDGGGWLQVYQNNERAGSGSVTLAVDSLADQINALEKLGIDSGPQMNNAVASVVMIKDPDGNSIAFAEATDPSIAQ